MEGGKMTDKQINAAIAESLGWNRREWIDKKGRSCSGWRTPSGKELGGHPPNYTSDLNACHEFEKKLSLRDRADYTSWLYESSLNLGTATWESAHATARQRCEAYLRTLGKWIE